MRDTDTEIRRKETLGPHLIGGNMFPLWIGYAMRPSFSHLSQRLGQFINLSLDFPPLRSNLRNIIRFNVKNRVHATHCNRDALHLRSHTHTHILPLFILELSTHSSLVEPQRRGDNYPSLRNDVIACRMIFLFLFFLSILSVWLFEILNEIMQTKERSSSYEIYQHARYLTWFIFVIKL